MTETITRYILQRKSDGKYRKNRGYWDEVRNWVDSKEKAQLFVHRPLFIVEVGFFWRDRYREFMDSIAHLNLDCAGRQKLWNKEKRRLRPQYEEWFYQHYEIYELNFSK